MALPRALPLVLLVLGSCAGDDLVHLPSPELAGVRTLIIAQTQSDAIASLRAESAQGDWVVLLDPAEQVTLLGYAAELETLGLRLGPLEPDLERRDCRLGFPELILTTERGGDGQLSWQSGALEAELRDRLVDRRHCAPCVAFEEELVFVTEKGRLWTSIRLASGAALSSRTGSSGKEGLMRIDHERAEPIDGCVTSRLLALWPLGQNRFWIGRAGDTLSLVSIDEERLACSVETSTRTSSSALAGGSAIFMAGSAPGEDFELFVVDSRGRLYRFDGERAELLMSLELHPADLPSGLNRIGGLARLGPGRAAFAVGSDQVGWWDRGEQRIDHLAVSGMLEPTGLGRVSALGWVPEVGLVVGSSAGELILLREDGGREPLSGSDTANEIGGILPFGGGFLAIAKGGTIVQFHGGRELCSEPTLVGSSKGREGRGAFLSPDGLFVSDLVEIDGDPHALWLRRVAD